MTILIFLEFQKRLSELESCVNPGDNVIENRLKKDIENLKREKKVLLEDIEVFISIILES